jgi:hypothetical protein
MKEISTKQTIKLNHQSLQHGMIKFKKNNSIPKEKKNSRTKKNENIVQIHDIFTQKPL